jgi:hypothetical protein
MWIRVGEGDAVGDAVVEPKEKRRGNTTCTRRESIGGVVEAELVVEDVDIIMRNLTVEVVVSSTRKNQPIVEGVGGVDADTTRLIMDVDVDGATTTIGRPTVIEGDFSVDVD